MSLQRELRVQGDYLFKKRSYLPLFFLAAGLGVFLYEKYFESIDPDEITSNYYVFVCLAISLLGFLIRITTVGHTPKNTSGRNTGSGQIADELNTTGIYSTVRHPLYLGNFFMWMGVAMLTENLWFTIAFILLYWIYYERIMYAEENFLILKFNNTYLNWASQTPAFIPSPQNYQRPKYSFSLKKVLKKEKNGLAAVFLIFWLFQWSENVVTQRKIFQLNLDFWFYAAIFSSTLYVILKILKKKKLLQTTNR